MLLVDTNRVRSNIMPHCKKYPLKIFLQINIQTADARDVKSENAGRRLTFNCLRTCNIYIYVYMYVLLDRLPSC